MKISYYTPSSNLRTDNGYGYAGHNIKKSLEKLGHTVGFHDADADVELAFCQPYLYDHYPSQYKIGYTPWESSELPEGWLDGFNAVDEVWTTSEKCAEWYQEAGVTRPIHVYKHGIEDIWTPVKRGGNRKLRFLHIGEPAPRKGGQMAMEAFIAAFGASDDVELTIKAHGHSTVRVYASNVRRDIVRSILGLPGEVYKSINVIDHSLSIEDLVALYHNHDVLVYPSWGEGFGFIPLQGLATGMPTICPSSWAPYDNHLGELALESHEESSPWPSIHPGNMYRPDFEHLVELYRFTYENFDRLSESFYTSASNVHAEYDWDVLTKNAFAHLGEK